MTKIEHNKRKRNYAVTINGLVDESILTFSDSCMQTLMCRQSIILVRQLEHLQNGQVNIASFKHATLPTVLRVPPIMLCDCTKTTTQTPLKPA